MTISGLAGFRCPSGAALWWKVAERAAAHCWAGQGCLCCPQPAQSCLHWHDIGGEAVWHAVTAGSPQQKQGCIAVLS